MDKKRSGGFKQFIPIILVPIIFIGIIAMYSTYKPKTTKMSYSELVQLFYDNRISEYSLNLSSGALKYKLRDPVVLDDSQEDNENSEAEDTTEETTVDTPTESDSSTSSSPVATDVTLSQSKEETTSQVDSANSIIVNKYTVPDVNIFYKDVHEYIINFNQNCDEKDRVKIEYISGSANSWITSMLPSLGMLAVMAAIFYFMMRRMGQGIINENNKSMSFGKAKIHNGKNGKKVTFDDVAGADEEKEELAEIVDFLKNPEKYSEIGARVPKGVLLVGPPGTGKTLLAKAVAGEADVPFLSISGSDFLEMYVGVGASRVRDLFEQAKKNSPAIIFIDEIDAVGRHRGAGMGGGHDEREQTLNQMLVEMDGFVSNEGVIVIAATNRPDILDPALLRPGRFDRQVTVGYPDIKGREAILNVHARNKSFAPDVVLSDVAKATVGFTGADLENLLNEAALLSARRKLKSITKAEIDEATIKVVVGTEKKSHKVSDEEKKLTAYHEAGHAVSSHFLGTLDPVHQVSIIPRGMAGGYTMHLPEKDRSYASKHHMEDELVTLLGGRVAEALILGDISTGASNDIERASEIARNMVTKYGMSSTLGPICFGSGEHEVFLGKDYGTVRNYSEDTANRIDEEVNRIIMTAYKRCETVLNEHMDKLHTLAKYLIENEKIDGEGFLNLMQDMPETVTTE